MPNAIAKTLMPSARRRLAAVVCLMLMISVVLLELFCRFYLGLGDPPLSMNDSEMGYLFKPSQTCRRFNNLIHYNAYSMRSDDFPPRKASTDEFRVMVIGDSVINGGAPTDQSQVCTSILQKELAGKLHRPVVVGNISAGGWGPLNEWPYVKKYGLFDADAVVIVLSSHDASSTFQTQPVAGADPSFPEHKPWCATWEGITRYLPRYLPFTGQAASNEGFQEGGDDPEVVKQCMDAEQKMIGSANAAGAKSLVILHWNQAELKRAAEIKGWRPEGHRQMEETARAAGAEVVDLGNQEDAADYRDNIHLSGLGQKQLADAIQAAIARSETGTPLVVIAAKKRK